VKNIYIIILNLLSVVCISQVDSAKLIREKVDEGIANWFKKPTYNDGPIDTAVMNSLKDSGKIVNGIKQGFWKEYHIDSSLYGYKQKVVSDGKIFEHISKALIIDKEVGNYVDNKREGMWTTYQSYDTKAPLFWQKEWEIYYLHGIKDSTEILYQNVGTKPLLIANYRNGKLWGVYKEYYYNYPYNLKRVYECVDGRGTLKKQYYENGTMEYIYTDTLLNGITHLFYRNFDRSGFIKESGYLIHDTVYDGKITIFFPNGKIQSIINYKSGVMEGEEKYFFDNGQLWSTRIIKNGVAWTIINNYNKKGEKMDGGTLKDGNGTLILYDEKGKLVEIENYKNGIEINSK